MPLLLTNTRNHCYSNVSIQLLYSNKTTRSFFLEKKYRNHGSQCTMPICDELYSIFKTEGREETSTEYLRVLVARKSGIYSFEDGSMEDSLLFLDSLLKMLEREIPQSNIEGQRILDGFVGHETIQRRFLNNSLEGHCIRCQTIPSITENPFRWLIPDMIDTQINLQLQNLLDNYFTVDIAEMKCSVCCNHLSDCPVTGFCRLKPVNSTKCFSKVPDNLIIQINRFNEASRERVPTVVEANEIIELPAEENNVKVSVKYSLSAVIDFIGESKNCGHYIVHVKSSNGWLECNDTIISPSGQAKLRTNRNYIYHYIRINENEKIERERSEGEELNHKIDHTIEHVLNTPRMR